MFRRSILRGVGLLGTSALLAGMLLAPGASAATPPLETSQYAAPDTISDGGTGAVVFSIYNPGKSNVSQLYLVDVAVDGGTFLTAYASQGSCTDAIQECAFGQLRRGQTATVIVAFTATAGVTPVTVSAVFNTTGLGSSEGGDNSHGDAWHVSQAVNTSTDAQDFAGRFVDSAGNLLVQNNQNLSDTNPHTTKVVAPKTLIGVSVQDGATVAQPCDATKVNCAGLFGQTSVINVAQGGTFPGGFQIVIGFDKSEIVGVNQNTLKIYHTYGSGQYEVIDTRCTFAKNSTVPKSLPCLTVRKDGPNLWATIWTTHNGVMRGLG